MHATLDQTKKTETEAARAPADHRAVSDGGAAPPAAASVVDVTKTYGRGDTAMPALDGVTMDFPAGEFTAIMGPSGSGKSTLLHCMAGLDRATSGEIRIAGVRLADLSEHRLTLLRRDRVGFIFQSYNLVPTLSAGENIDLPLSIAGLRPNREWREAVVEAVGLRARLRHRPNELSGGQQQRVAAARALVSRPAIIFADEPSGNLDSRSGAELLGFMRRSVDDFGQTIVMVTHDAVAAGHAHRVLFLKDGRLVDEMAGPRPDAILDRIKSLGE